MKKGVVLVLLLCALCVSLLCFYGSWTNMCSPWSPAGPCCKGRNVTVLLWHWPFGGSDSLKGDVCQDLYGITRCQLLDNRSSFSLADVVVFHNRELVEGREKLPLALERPPGQMWAWMSMEAPSNNGNLQPFAGHFNMTMTYRRDSDVPLPYGERVPVVSEGDAIEYHPLNKSHLICWVVSNYQRHHKRSRVYSQLRAVVPIKVYGSWTGSRLSQDALLPTISHCHFYLAFENSLSKDYITEKLWWNAYKGGAVPVVLGASPADYAAVAPPGSYIHVDQFASVQELGKYLQELAADEQRYREFFAWKRRWSVKRNTDWKERLCRVCLHYHRLPQHKVYSDLMGWVHDDS